MHSAQSPPILNTTPVDPRESPWYPYDNGAGGFDANIAMILIFLFCALVCGLALHAVIRFFLRRSHPLPSSSATTTTTTTATTLPDDHKLIAADSVAFPAAPSLVYSAGMKLAGAAAECAICLSEFVSGEGVRVLPRCKHGFHVKCIEGWLSSHSSCPTCRSSCLAMPPDKTAAAVGPETNVDIESQLEQPIQQHQHQQRSDRE